MKCSKISCIREAQGQFRQCLACRRNDVESRRRRIMRGSCSKCEQPKLIGYNLCHCCEIKNILRWRARQNSVIHGVLYVLQTPRGIKVGRSMRLQARIREVSNRYFGGARLQLIAEYEGMGHLEPFVHLILNAFRIPERREEFTCDLQTFMMAYDHVKAYDIFGRLKDLPPDPRLAGHQGINGADDPSGPAASASTHGGGPQGRDARGRSRTRAGTRARTRSASSSHAESEGEESAQSA